MAENKTQHKGQSLTGLIGKRRVEGPVPPILTLTCPMPDTLIDAPINIEGVSSEMDEEASERFSQMIADHLATKCQEGTDEHGREQNPA